MSTETLFDLQTDDSDIEIDGMRVDAYRNLNKDNITVLCRESTHDEYDYGEKVAGVDLLVIENPQFIVRPGGRERVRNEGRKNVHAFVRGTAQGVDMDGEVEWNMMARIVDNDMANVNYDPYEMEQFEVTEVISMEDHMYEVGDEVTGASRCCVTTDGVGCMFGGVDV